MRLAERARPGHRHTGALITRSRGRERAPTSPPRRRSPAARSRFVGRVGDDAAGERLVAGLAAVGVDVRVQRGGRTGTVVVLVEPGGERTMLPDRGAAPAARAGRAGVARRRHVDPRARVLAVRRADRRGSTRRARRPGRGAVARGSASTCRRSASSSAFGAERFAALLDELAPDVVFANAAEAELVGAGARPAARRQGRGPARSCCGGADGQRGAGAGRRRRRGSSTRPGRATRSPAASSPPRSPALARRMRPAPAPRSPPAR